MFFTAASESLVEQVLVMEGVFIAENASECMMGPFISRGGGLALIYWLSKSEMMESTLNHWVQQQDSDFQSSAKAGASQAALASWVSQANWHCFLSIAAT